MSEDGQKWQDIKPRLIRDADGWHVEGAPYYAEVKDNGTRLFLPDKRDSKAIRLPTFDLVRWLQKNVASSESILDRQLLDNKIVMPFPDGEIRFIFTNTALKFEIYLTKAPKFDRLQIPFDSDFDIAGLLSRAGNTGIPRPRLISGDTERVAEWSYKDGLLELGLDFTGLEFPLLFKNTTINAQVGASGDDGCGKNSGSGAFLDSGVYTIIGYNSGYAANFDSWFRFTGISGLSGATINSALISFRTHGTAMSGTPLTRCYFEDAASPAAPSNEADHQGRTRTTAYTEYDPSGLSGDTWYNDEVDVQSIVQEIADDYDPSTLQVLWDDDGSTGGGSSNALYISTYDDNSSYGLKLDIEYTAGGAGGFAHSYGVIIGV